MDRIEEMKRILEEKTAKLAALQNEAQYDLSSVGADSDVGSHSQHQKLADLLGHYLDKALDLCNELGIPSKHYEEFEWVLRGHYFLCCNESEFMV